MSRAELADPFARYDTVLSCIGFAAGPGTQLKLARAALASGIRRCFPWQFGVDDDVLGRGSPQSRCSTGSPTCATSCAPGTTAAG